MTGCAEIWFTLANGVYNIRCRYDQIEHASEEALRHAALAGQRRTHLFLLPMALTLGPRPVDEALARLAELTSLNVDDDGNGAILVAMRGDLDEARALLDVEVARWTNSAWRWVTPLSRTSSGSWETTRRAAEQLGCLLRVPGRARGTHRRFPPTPPSAAATSARWGASTRPSACADQGRELGHADDPITQALWRRVLALVLAHRGDPVEAQRLVREALVIAQTTDSPWYQGETLADLAQVLEAAGRLDEATAAHREALELYERKGIKPLARRTRERLAALQAPTA